MLPSFKSQWTMPFECSSTNASSNRKIVIFFLNCAGSWGFPLILAHRSLLWAEVPIQIAIFAVFQQQVEVALVFEDAFASDDSSVQNRLLQFCFSLDLASQSVRFCIVLRLLLYRLQCVDLVAFQTPDFTHEPLRACVECFDYLERLRSAGSVLQVSLGASI